MIPGYHSQVFTILQLKDFTFICFVNVIWSMASNALVRSAVVRVYKILQEMYESVSLVVCHIFD